MTPRYPLSGVRIVDLTTGIAGPYCTKLFADAGADVLKVESASGDPARGWAAAPTSVAPGASGAFFAFLNASKQSVVADLQTEQGAAMVRAMCAAADLVVEDFTPGSIEALGLGIEALHAQNPATSLLSISPFGRGGPWSTRPANEFTLQAQVGSLDYRGLPGFEPVAAGGALGDFTVAAFAAPAALAALHMTRHTGRGVHVDVSQFEAMMLSFQVFRQIFATFDPGRPLGRSFEIPSIEPAADGFVGFCTITSQQYTDFCNLIGAPELAAPHMMFADARMAAREELWSKIRAYTAHRSVDEIVTLAAAMRIPVSPVGNGSTVLMVDHFIERGVFVENPAGFVQPRPPYQFSDIALRPIGPTPRLGADSERVRDEVGGAARSRTRIGTGAAAAVREGAWLPLAGVKVADFSAFWAGPVVTEMLGALGADVIKIESIQRPDGMRFSAGMQKPQVWEWSPVSQSVNVGKRGITLDLGQADGRALAMRLVDWADIVVENFSPRVMEQFGFDWPDVRASNPRAVMLRMPAFGLDGPWRDRTGFAMTIEQASGLAWVTGHRDGPPMVPRGVCDPVGGMHAAFAVLLALRERDRTGQGCLIEVPLIEVGLNAAAEQIVEWSANDILLERMGNRSRRRAPQGVYESAATDQWVAVSVETDGQWLALCRAIGAEDLRDDALLVNLDGRLAAHDRIDAALAAFVVRHNPELAAELLLAAGVPAAPCINAIRAATSIHHDVRRFHQWMQHPVCGWVPYPGFPFTVDGAFATFARPAPVLGQHNHEVLHGILGLDDDTIAALAEARVIGDWPAWMERPD